MYTLYYHDDHYQYKGVSKHLDKDAALKKAKEVNNCCYFKTEYTAFCFKII